MIISSGYNISGPEVEEALLAHAAVSDCACVVLNSKDEATKRSSKPSRIS